MLPQLEQQPLYSSINFNLPILELTSPYYCANTTAGLAAISTLLCPSESLSPNPSFNLATFEANPLSVQFAVSNYVGNYGGPAMIKAWSGTIIPVKGPPNRLTIAYFSMAASSEVPPATCGPVRVQSITDGTSNTALFSERLLGAGSKAAVPGPNAAVGGIDARRALFQTTFNVVLDQKDAQGALAYVSACKSLPGGTPAASYPGMQWMPSIDYAPLENAYSHVMAPNGFSCTGSPDGAQVIGSSLYGGIGAAITATSNHPGGVNIAFCDGSVKFIKDSINLSAWWALGTRDGHEIISADAY